MKFEAMDINCLDMICIIVPLIWGAYAFMYETLKVYTHPNSRKKDFLFSF